MNSLHTSAGVYAALGAPQFADFEVAADEIAVRNWPPCKRPTI